MKPAARMAENRFKRPLRIVVLAALALGLLGSLGLTIVAVSRMPLLCLLGLLLLSASVVHLLHSSRRRSIASLGSILGLCVALSPAAFAPRGSGGDSRIAVTHNYLEPGRSFSRFTLSNVLPEEDWVSLGISLAPLFDPHIDRGQSGRLREIVLPVYSGLRRDPAFAEIGSVLSRSYRVNSRHYVSVTPRQAGDAPLVVFFHGGAGNFACYWFALAPLARDHRMALVFPTRGFGTWRGSEDPEFVLRVISDAVSHLPQRPRDTFLVGLSNGANGVLRTLSHRPEAFRGVALISPAVADDVVEATARPSAWSGKRVLLMHGREDRRSPVARTVKHAATLRNLGADVTLDVRDGRDHFLFLADLPDVLKTIAEWIR